jgi:hypothetical protein
MTQYFFVDESGDPGICSTKNSPYYVVAMVQVPNREPIPELASLRRELHLSPGFEFHFYRANARQKELFFQAIQPFLFRVRAVALLKANIPPELRNLNSTNLEMELLTRLTLRASELDIANDILVLDSAPDSFLKSLRIHLTRVCKQQQRERPFKKIVSSDSKHDDGLQLADMLAGAIRLSIWENTPMYYQMFAKKVVDMWKEG